MCTPSQLHETVQLVMRGQISGEPGTMGHRAVQQFKLLQSQVLGIKVSMSCDSHVISA